MHTLKKVRDALVGVCDNVGHYSTLKDEVPRVVWEEDSARGLRADNRTQGQIFAGGIHLFSLDEFDPLFESVQNALDDAGISYRFNSHQHEDETGIEHWEWLFSVV